MIKLNVFDEKLQHFLLSADQPMRVEVSLTTGGKIIAHVYKGHKIKKTQKPCGVFDGTVGSDDWKIK